jgi:hypothetical protein
MIGTVVGRLPVLAGRLTVCQLPVTEGAISGDPLCVAILRDVCRWAGAMPLEGLLAVKPVVD